MKEKIKTAIEKKSKKITVFSLILPLTELLLFSGIIFMVTINLFAVTDINSKLSSNDNIVYLKELVTHICKTGVIFIEAIAFVPYIVKLLNDIKLKKEKKINDIIGIICSNIVFAILIICTAFFYHPIIEFFLI